MKKVLILSVLIVLLSTCVFADAFSASTEHFKIVYTDSSAETAALIYYNCEEIYNSISRTEGNCDKPITVKVSDSEEPYVAFDIPSQTIVVNNTPDFAEDLRATFTECVRTAVKAANGEIVAVQPADEETKIPEIAENVAIVSKKSRYNQLLINNGSVYAVDTGYARIRNLSDGTSLSFTGFENPYSVFFNHEGNPLLCVHESGLNYVKDMNANVCYEDYFAGCEVVYEGLSLYCLVRSEGMNLYIDLVNPKTGEVFNSTFAGFGSMVSPLYKLADNYACFALLSDGEYSISVYDLNTGLIASFANPDDLLIHSASSNGRYISVSYSTKDDEVAKYAEIVPAASGFLLRTSENVLSGGINNPVLSEDGTVYYIARYSGYDIICSIDRKDLQFGKEIYIDGNIVAGRKGPAADILLEESEEYSALDNYYLIAEQTLDAQFVSNDYQETGIESGTSFRIQDLNDLFSFGLDIDFSYYSFDHDLRFYTVSPELVLGIKSGIAEFYTTAGLSFNNGNTPSYRFAESVILKKFVTKHNSELSAYLNGKVEFEPEEGEQLSLKNNNGMYKVEFGAEYLTPIRGPEETFDLRIDTVWSKAFGPGSDFDSRNLKVSGSADYNLEVNQGLDEAEKFRFNAGVTYSYSDRRSLFSFSEASKSVHVNVYLPRLSVLPNSNHLILCMPGEFSINASNTLFKDEGSNSALDIISTEFSIYPVIVRYRNIVESMTSKLSYRLNAFYEDSEPKRSESVAASLYFTFSPVVAKAVSGANKLLVGIEWEKRIYDDVLGDLSSPSGVTLFVKTVTK